MNLALDFCIKYDTLKFYLFFSLIFNFLLIFLFTKKEGKGTVKISRALSMFREWHERSWEKKEEKKNKSTYLKQ